MNPRRARLLIGLPAVGLVALSAFMAIFPVADSSQTLPLSQIHTVSRDDVVVTVTAKGVVESSRQTEVKCEIRGGYGGRGGRSTVTWVIPSGSMVNEGDELVRLDTKVIEETISLGKTDTNLARAALARTEADLATAELNVTGYLQGTYVSQMKALERRLAVTARNREASRKMLETATALFRQGYVTELELEANGYTARQAELELTVIETEIDVLQRLTRAMELETLNGELMATRSRLKGRRAGLVLEERRLALALDELERSTIRAPRSGLVIYPSTASWKDTPDITEGASVHNHQILLLMPDLSDMQVGVTIHESVVHRMRSDLPARVTLPDRVLETEVTSVASVSSPAGWWNGNTVNYDAVIRLPSVEGLRPGTSADVEITIARYESVLSVPVSAVVETEEGHFCWIESAGGAERQSLELGDSDDAVVVVEQGLEEGDRVVLDPTASLEEARRLAGTERVHAIRRGDLTVTVTEQGSLESADNTQIKCRVRGSSTINWVVPNGTVVEAGDELVRLENKEIEEYLHERTKFAHLSRDAAIGFRAQERRAELAIAEFLEGRYRTRLLGLEKDLAVAESRLRTERSILDHARALLEKGYSSRLDVEQSELALREAEATLEIKRIDLDVHRRFTRKEGLATLRGNWEAAKAAANAHEEILRMDEARMALAEQEIERSVIRAERGGLVIYPSAARWKNTPDIAEGATAHNDQVLLLMPDLAAMQAAFRIEESMVDRVRPGMPATVTLPDRTIEGEVVSVASTAPPAGWWTGNTVKYDAVVRLPEVEGLRPGMSAEIAVTIARHDNVLLVPLAAIDESDQGMFCLVRTPDGPRRRAIEIGDSNEAFAVVTSGLEEGDEVIPDPTSSGS